MTTPLRVLVTAGASGIGRAIGDQFLASGARVLVCDINANGLDSGAQSDNGLMFMRADAGSENDVIDVVDAAKEKLGGLDVLINNVGIAGPTKSPDAISLDEWDEAVRINLTSHFLFTRQAIPLMKQQDGGLIINISSMSAKTGLPNRLPYVVSKGALLSMTHNLARELGPYNIRVNAILPGPVRGERIERVFERAAAERGVSAKQYQQEQLRYISLRCMVEAEDIAAAALYLASPGGSRVSGQCLGVDGNVEWEP